MAIKKRKAAPKIDVPKDVSGLKDAPYNPRSIGARAQDGLQFSIEEFGDISGLVFNIRSGNLVAGHQRKRVLRDDAPIEDFVEEQDPTGTVGFAMVRSGQVRMRLRLVDWDSKKEKAANIAANNAAITGDWTEDIDSLLMELRDDAPDIYDQALLHEIMDEDRRVDRVAQRSEKRRAAIAGADVDTAPELYESYDYVVLLFRNEVDWLVGQEHFGLKKNRGRAPKDGQLGLGRVIDGTEYLKRLSEKGKDGSKD